MSEEQIQQLLQEEEEELQRQQEEEEEDDEEDEEQQQQQQRGHPMGLFGAMRMQRPGGNNWAQLVEGLNSEDPTEMLVSASEFSAQLLHAATQEQLQG